LSARPVLCSHMRIGNLVLSNPVFLAPMAGITDLPFRILNRQFGCNLACTEMVSSHGLVRRNRRSLKYLEHPLEDAPLAVQLFGSDPESMAEAAKIAAEHGADLIDLNMGCPVKKVVKAGAGAALLKRPAVVRSMIRAVRKEISLPLTVKIRSGWRQGEINAREIARIVQEEGGDALTVHPRTADQGFSGSADWSLIRQVKDGLSIPVIGSGDIWGPEDADRMIKQTGCDAVMIGRGALGNPWIFAGALNLLSGRDPVPVPLSERYEIIRRHLDMNLACTPEHSAVMGFRKHLLWYTKGLRGGAEFRQVASRVSTREELLDVLSGFFDTLQR